MREFFTNLFCKMIRLYQVTISPLLGPCCRFYPSCSHYAMEAIQKYGPGKGIILSGKRILRCNKFFKGGFDPVP